ncbi:MAG TPA: hypothetical protein PKN33_21320 [Phycisphaerae bacterium]|nr:hypothetical protein [Phycisphaerae bacterium]
MKAVMDTTWKKTGYQTHRVYAADAARVTVIRGLTEFTRDAHLSMYAND